MASMMTCLVAPVMSCLGSCLGSCACAAMPKRAPPARASYAVLFAAATVAAWCARDEGAKTLARFTCACARASERARRGARERVHGHRDVDEGEKSSTSSTTRWNSRVRD